MSTGSALPGETPSRVAGETGRLSGSKGFTLVELMIVLVLLAVLLGIGIPSFRAFIADQRLRATSNDLRIALMTAKSEAVKRNRDMEVTPASGSWSSGWSILDPNDVVVLSHTQPEGGNVVITVDDGTPARFSAAGRAVNSIDFDIQVGTGSDAAIGCLSLGLDGRATFVKAGCP